MPTNRQIAESCLDKEAPTPLHWSRTRDWSIRKIIEALDEKDRSREILKRDVERAYNINFNSVDEGGMGGPKSY